MIDDRINKNPQATNFLLNSLLGDFKMSMILVVTFQIQFFIFIQQKKSHELLHS